MIVLNVKEMSCNHCVERISKALDPTGIKYEINLDNKTVSVDGSENCAARVVEELDDLGFTAERVGA